jgi:hypothetical protein
VKIEVTSFSGMRPMAAAHLLNPGEAVLARNTYVRSGALRPLPQVSAVVTALTSASPIKSVYRFGQASTDPTQFWFQSGDEANFVRGPIDGDTEETTFFTGVLAYPAKTRSSIATASAPYPSGTFRMGLPQPAAPIATVSGTATVSTSPVEVFAYVVTLVSTWGEESQPSPPSNLVSVQLGQTVTLTTGTSAAGEYPLSTGARKRIYRSATGSTGTARYLLVNTSDSMALTAGAYADTVQTSALGEALRSKGWAEPPTNMQGLVSMANGIMAGFSDSTVCFCEPWTPHAWPVRYQQSVNSPVVGMMAFDQSLLVATKRGMYVFTGADPAAMSNERLSVPHTVVSKRSMVAMNNGVMFATGSGIGFISSAGFQMISADLLTRKQWQAYAPATMHAYESEGRYLCFYDNGTKAGLVLTLGSAPSFSETSIYATAGFRDPTLDVLFLCVDGGGSTRNIVKFDDASNGSSTMVWLSGEFVLDSAANMGIARVDCEGTTQFELLADGVVKYLLTGLLDKTPFKLPSGYRSYRYQVRLTGINGVRGFALADSMRSLIGG